MLFLDVEKDGVLGWQDWRTFDVGESNWTHDEPANWKPDYHGDGRRGLTTPDALSVPSSLGERHASAYWLKEGVFRLIRKRLAEARAADTGQATRLDAIERDLTRLYYTGRFKEYAARIAEVPAQ